MIRKMGINFKFLLFLCVVLPQLVISVKSTDGQRSKKWTVSKKCGNPGSDVQMRIIDGDAFERGEFPWMVALTRNVTNQAPDFFGAGTLVSFRHVITGNVRNQILRFSMIQIFNILIRVM